MMRRFKPGMAKTPIGLSCRGIEKLVDVYLENDLGWVTKLKVRLHLAMCRECDAYIQAYAAARQLVKAALRKGADEACSLPDEITKKILTANESRQVDNTG